MSAPVGVWLIAGTAIDKPYPCRCKDWGICSPKYCPCAGRLDLANCPPGCCAHSYSPWVAAAAQRMR